jgi:uncharacterized protein (TIGR02453 family)
VGFAGFGERLVDFYEGLEADNSKVYWTSNRAVYDEHVAAPMVALLAELEDEFGAGKVFRPYRDVRFSKDKTPYKTHCGGVAADRYYVQVDAEGIYVAAGYYETASDQVLRYRTAVDDERRGAALSKELDRLQGLGFILRGHQLKRVPRGFDPEHPRADLLRYKTLWGARRWIPDDELHSADCLDRVRAAWRELRPLNDWLDDHVGRSDQPPSRRR